MSIRHFSQIGLELYNLQSNKNPQNVVVAYICRFDYVEKILVIFFNFRDFIEKNFKRINVK